MERRILFIHRSVGRNLLHDGRVYERIKDSKIPFTLDDYDQNIDVLTSAGARTKPGFSFPGSDTKPEDYAQIFSATRRKETVPILELALSYDAVAIKSCYPNSHIASDEQLEAIKGYYLEIAQFFALQPAKQLIILSSPR